MSGVPSPEEIQRPSLIPSGFPGPLAPLASLWTHPHLIWQLTRQEILARYRGSIFGLLWSFITPLVLLAMFTFVFSIIFSFVAGIFMMIASMSGAGSAAFATLFFIAPAGAYLSLAVGLHFLIGYRLRELGGEI